MLKKLLLAAATLLFLVSAASAQTFTIDPVHSSANFAVRHMMVSTVKGRFSEVNGTIVFDEKEPWKCSVKATINVASITTDNAMRDNHLKTPDFFDAAKYPTITFVSTKVWKQGGKYFAEGKLTIKNVTKDVILPFELNTAMAQGKKHMGVETTLHIDRLDYNVSFDPTGTTVGKDVTIEIDLEAIAG
jgi:polyisoprenoid-binding protein YceI